MKEETYLMGGGSAHSAGYGKSRGGLLAAMALKERKEGKDLVSLLSSLRGKLGYLQGGRGNW